MGYDESKIEFSRLSTVTISIYNGIVVSASTEMAGRDEGRLVTFVGLKQEKVLMHINEELSCCSIQEKVFHSVSRTSVIYSYSTTLLSNATSC